MTGYGVVIEELTGDICNSYTLTVNANTEKELIRNVEDCDYVFQDKYDEEYIFTRRESQYHQYHRVIFKPDFNKLRT